MNNKNNSINEELRNLWKNRQTLNNEQWERLYQIVFNTLKNFVPSYKTGKNKGKKYEFEHFTTQEDLVNEFIYKKIIESDTLSECYHTGALRLFYTRFLQDILRHEENSRYGEKSYNDVVKEISQQNNSDSIIDDEKIYDTVENKSKVIYNEYIYNSKFTTLGDLHLNFDDIENSAKQWLEKQESWVKLFLGRSYCQDSKNSEALSKLAKKEHIKSYAYKAEQLGFNWKSPDYKEYKNTMIGQWISTLNVEFSPENIKVIGEILKILCLTALSLVDEENI